MKANPLYQGSFLLACLAIAAYMGLSASMLWTLGDPYSSTTGNFIFKIHPGSYLLLGSLMLLLFAHGNPVATAINLIRHSPSLLLHAVGMVGLVVYSVARYGPSGSAFVIETFVMPALVALILINFEEPDRRAIYRLILQLLVLNACIGLGEALLHRHLLPYTIVDGVRLVEVGDTFRSTALLGHPLVNATMTASLLFTCLDLPGMRGKVALICLFLLAVLVFGSRAAFGVAVSVLGLYLLVTAISGVLRGRFTYLQTLGGAICAILLLTGIVGIVDLFGFGERIFNSLYMDNSAVVRIHNLQVFDFMNMDDITFGLSPTDIRHVIEETGLHYPYETIENPWLFMLMQFGIVGLTVLGVSLLMLVWWIFPRSGAGGRLALISFFLIVSTYNSLAAKTCTLTLLVAALTALTGYRTAATARRNNTLPYLPIVDGQAEARR